MASDDPSRVFTCFQRRAKGRVDAWANFEVIKKYLWDPLNTQYSVPTADVATSSPLSSPLSRCNEKHTQGLPAFCDRLEKFDVFEWVTSKDQLSVSHVIRNSHKRWEK